MTATPRHPNVETAVRYHAAVASQATGEELARFFHPDAVQREYPNALAPDGAVRDLPAILAAAERGRAVLSEQAFDIVEAVAAGDTVALEAVWRGTLAVPLGTLPAGHELRARLAVFLEFRDGRIVAQRNYDCFDRLA
ncbi:nuclear transport factor 2 family protein [Streptomyces huiliensis]|uniref:nuclear transport factor 2 family protein n=1 Tax=Streptomyces huiliensis TaxID=2876027 RepID=UPI001CBAA033|nr:nuclear transport factor 2 family protein [Streptomyces huiliensis]MBZ4322927.1 ester cyclase [Streptomyces huiliensis]